MEQRRTGLILENLGKDIKKIMEKNMNNSNYDIKDKKLSPKGRLRIEWAGGNMPVLNLIRERFGKEKPLKGITIGACLHVTAETANLVLTLKEGGAKVYLCASNPLSTQDDVAASLVVDSKVPVYAIRGEDKKTYYRHLEEVFKAHPNMTMDDGADLINELHKFQITNSKSQTSTKYQITNSKRDSWEFYGSAEETTTGVIRLKAMEKMGVLKVPVVAVNDSDTKHLFDNRYGTGQSTIDGIIRATNILLAGKTFVVCGYGWCGRGLASRARGMGASVVVCEIDPVRALEAVMEGFRVMPMNEAAKQGDIFVTATGNKGVVTISHMRKMKDGAIVANTGHFNVEVEVDQLQEAASKRRKLRENVEEYKLLGKRIYVLGEGRLINLVAAEGHPPDVMDMSFANQALACEWFVGQKTRLAPKVYQLPEKLDKMVARLKLAAMGVTLDKLTVEQKKYLSGWSEGT